MTKLGNIADVKKKTVFGQVVTKVIGIEAKLPITIGLLDKPQFDNDKQNIRKQVEDVNNEILV